MFVSCRFPSILQVIFVTIFAVLKFEPRIKVFFWKFLLFFPIVTGRIYDILLQLRCLASKRSNKNRLRRMTKEKKKNKKRGQKKEKAKNVIISKITHFSKKNLRFKFKLENDDQLSDPPIMTN